MFDLDELKKNATVTNSYINKSFPPNLHILRLILRINEPYCTGNGDGMEEQMIAMFSERLNITINITYLSAGVSILQKLIYIYLLIFSAVCSALYETKGSIIIWKC